MEPPTPRTMPSWLLLLCLVASGLLQALAQSNPPGFISIDCGLPGETGYVDSATTLPYTTDAGFIGAYVGSNHNIAAIYMTSPLPNNWWYTLRSFPVGKRNCYTLGSLVPGLKYLIRARFFYGNYDGFNYQPFFDLYVGVDFWMTVNIRASNTAVLAEAIVMVPRDSVQVCLVNTGGGVPFISAPFGKNMYRLVKILHTYYHKTQLINCFNRYPDDPFDRMWFPFSGNETTHWDEISTDMEVHITDDQFQPPQAVMQTANTPKNVLDNIEFTLNLHSSPTDPSLGYMELIYFSELEPLPSGALRPYNIYRNGGEIKTNYTPKYLDAGCIHSTEPFKFQASQYILSINPTANATLPPIINALELFSVMSTSTLGTDSQHVSAITAIKEMYQVQKNWMGDPCVPNTMVWDGLTCIYGTSGPPIISNVNVSFSGLDHTISPDFANLTDVRYLDLSNNNLIGSIPDTLSQLPSLIFLDLSNNKLSGSIPYGLLKKVQDGSLYLRYGNNPDLCSNGSTCQPAKGDSKLAIHIAVPVVVIVALVLVAILCFLLQRKRNQRSIRNHVKLTNDSDWNISLASENRQFTYMELEVITKNFQRSLGQGGFGFVFHGSLEKGTEVAVKLRSHSSNQGIKEFLAEAQVLTLIHHKNLVSMIGYCNDGGHMAVVYEYMPQGSLKELIAGKDDNKQCLPWGQRLRVALESAQGLEYLHKGCSPPIIHRDVKTANILLNARLEAKIADFGLSKVFNCEDDTHVSTNTFVGTYGYADPEYQRTVQPSTKSDVYSFGVVLLELVTGKPAIIRNPEAIISLVNWTRQRLAWGDIEGVVDPRMQGDHDINAIWKTTEIAFKCTEQSPLQRPSMTDVVMQLQECLDLEQGFKQGNNGFYTGSGNGEVDPNMDYNTTTNQSIDVSQNNATLR
ncbi:senescence-induced receptor-like serine/threonine-protein kinase [Triticum aestivum]|uniref:senescence-induced receptor-like serine/threonine-protein kinase n=1 Tax=Triticum aestivum TaxID=4565 RepID=UPI001D0184A6|nr:senescence-induced receptor-like serine/threonine-protein kinase [Triticum aestivum]